MNRRPERAAPVPVRPLATAIAALVALVTMTAAARAASAEPRRTDILVDLPRVGGLAAPANGQTLYVLDDATGGVTAVDPFKPERRWAALAAPAVTQDGTPERFGLALACVDTTRLALLCLDEGGFSLRVHSMQPDVTADAGAPLQVVPIATGTGAGRGIAGTGQRRPRPPAPAVVVGPTRDWIAVCGLPPPLPPVVRATIVGRKIGPLSPRGCPPSSGGSRPTAAAASPGDDLVLFAADGQPPAAGAFVSFLRPPDPRRLLHLDTGMPLVTAATFCRTGGTLWALGGQPGSATAAEGLWRLDGVLAAGRQAVRAVSVAALEAPRALCCLSEQALVVAHGRDRCSLTLFAPAPRPPAGEGKP